MIQLIESGIWMMAGGTLVFFLLAAQPQAEH